MYYVMWHHLITTKYPVKWTWVFLDPFFCQKCNQASNRQQYRCAGLVYPFKSVIVVYPDMKPIICPNSHSTSKAKAMHKQPLKSQPQI